MTGRYRTAVILGLAVGLVIIFLVLREPRETDGPPASSLLAPSAIPRTSFSSPLQNPTDTASFSPLPIMPTASSPVTTATLEALRATRPTATPPSSTRLQLPYISPATWRAWALRILALAGVLAYIGLRLRRT